MGKYLVKRLLRSIPVIFLISILVFFMVNLLPGDPAMHMFSGQEMSARTIALARETLGLDKPVPVRYWEWLTRILRGDLGMSIVARRPVAQMMANVIPDTLVLAFAAMVVTIVLGVSAGTIAAIKKDTIIDSLVMFFATLGVAMPMFWMGLLVLLYFSVHLRWFPVGGTGFKSLILPALVLGFQSACLVARLTRSSVLEVLGEDYIRTARSKGVYERRVIFIHMLKNALVPVFTVIGVQTSWLLGGTVIIETVFARRGMGKLAVEAIRQMDFPVLQAIVLLSSIIFVLTNILVDVLNSYIDPRIRYE